MDNAVPFLDRTAEIAVLDRGWREASANRGVLTFTAGGAGFGKSSLLRSWVGQLRPPVHVSIEFSGNLGATTSTVIEAFQKVITEHSRDLGSWKDKLIDLLGRDGGGISEVFPRNPWSTWFQPTAALLDRQQLERRFLLLLRALLRLWWFRYGTVLVTVDDWHLADGALQQLLLQLWQPDVALCCVATSRLAVEKLPLISPLHGQSEGSPEPPVTWILRRLELKPFAEAEVRSWIDRVFSTESVSRREFYTTLFAHAEGNPLYLQEIRRLITREKLPEKALRPLDSWFLREIQDLDPVLRGFLEAGAILGRTFSSSEAMRCADLPGESGGLVSAAVERRLIESRDGSCSWVHDLVREAILHLIDPPRYSILCGRAAIGILQHPSPAPEQVLRFPAFFQIGGEKLQLSEWEGARVEGLLRDSARLSRSSMDHDSAAGALALLRDQLETAGKVVSDEIWLFSAEVAFESGAIEETIQLLTRMRGTGSVVMKLTKELILCRCYYVARDFTGIFSRITRFSGVLWPARLLALLGPSLIGFLSSLVIPLLLRRLGKLSPLRIPRRRELTEHLHVALVIFLFQHSHALSSALGFVFAVLSLLRRSSHNLPAACVIIGMFGNLPRFARKGSYRLARFAREAQTTRGNPFWNDRVEFLFNLLYVPHMTGVQSAFAALKAMIAPGNRIRDPEVESLVKLTLIPNYFWSNAGIETLHRELFHHAQDAVESRNEGLAAIFETFCGLLLRNIRADQMPYRLREDATEEDFLFHALRARNERVVASGLRFEQAFFAILAGEWTVAREYVRKGALFRRDISYWMSRVSDGYIECLSHLLADTSGPFSSPYRILRKAVGENVREFGPYLTHIDAELARRRGSTELTLALYRRASDSFRRLERPILAALVDWRAGDLLWELSQQDIARVYLERSIRQFQQSGMSSSVRAIQAKYGLRAPGSITANGGEEEFMTVALRLHRLTLLGRLASEIAHEIKNVNHTLRLSAAVLESDLVTAAAESGQEEAMTGIMPAVRLIQDAASRIDQHLGQFRLTGGEPAGPETGAVDLGEVIHATISVMTPVLRRFTRRFEASIPSGKCFISGQPARIDQLVMNLVLNACESLSGIDQLIRVEAAADPARRLVGFRVVDQGCGIPGELLPRVMEPFFTTRREKGGTGLGLALCRRIVDEHHGEMIIESTQGVGTSVMVLFPSWSAE